ELCMKRIRTILSAALIAVLVLFSAGCGDDSSDEGGGVNSGELIVGPITEGVTKYYSLTTGEEVSGADIKTGKWDISFTRTRLIQTNSGSTYEYNSGAASDSYVVQYENF
ncbi:MAG: HmuY family protein, partial [Treponema sp.]|nr:HmuY family protein [Treponema sp.]